MHISPVSRAKNRMGRFKKGQSGNPNGRPKKSAEADLIALIERAGRVVTGNEEPLQALWEKVWDQSQNGCNKSQRMIADYAYGKPKQRIEADVNGTLAPRLVFEKAE